MLLKPAGGTAGDLFAGFVACAEPERNKGELEVIERKGKRAVYAMGKSFDRSSFQTQPALRSPRSEKCGEAGEAFLRSLLKASNRVHRLCIDRHGIGMNLAENLRTEFKSRVEGIALVGQVKESLAVGLKIAFENEAVAIPRDRELTAQIHSIKKTATDAGYARFDTERSEKHHADKMWSLALAVHATGAMKVKKKRRGGVQASVV